MRHGSACQFLAWIRPTASKPRAAEIAAGSGWAADARRNRDRILHAADEVFDEQGSTASTEEIARRAGVGIGTVFRHFATKEALLESVLIGRLDRVAEHAESLASSDDPGAAFTGFVTQTVEQARGKTAAAALADSGVDPGRATSAVHERLHQALTVLLLRAQDADAVPRDVGVAELIALLVGLTRASEHADWRPDVQARIVAVVLDGLRPGTHASDRPPHPRQ